MPDETGPPDTTQTEIEIKLPGGTGGRAKVSRTLENEFIHFVKTAPANALEWTQEQGARVLDLLGSGLQKFRLKNIQALFSRLRRDLGQSVDELPTLPDRLLLPVLRGASEESDDGMQLMWARLVVNSLSTKNAHAHFLHTRIARILGNLTPTAAALLEVIANLSMSEQGTEGKIDGLLFRGCVGELPYVQAGVDTALLVQIGHPDEQPELLEEALHELVSTGLCEWMKPIEGTPSYATWAPNSAGSDPADLGLPRYVHSVSKRAVSLTTLGARLLQTCSTADLGPLQTLEH